MRKIRTISLCLRRDGSRGSRSPRGRGCGWIPESTKGWDVPLDYDPLLAKLAVWAPSRDAAIARMKRALTEYVIAGIRTNRAFFGEIMDDAEFRAGALSTAFLDEFFARRQGSSNRAEAEAVAALAAVLGAAEASVTHGQPRRLRNGCRPAGSRCCDEIRNRH